DKVAITLLNTRADDPERQGISSKAAIRQAFVDLVIKAKAQDVLMVYFSGHGVTYGAAENAQFYYLTKDI
ncbi:MAG TPA: caspase family protein, partial [Saprospiraceae bacterium]|nr:caspase family protein [Saprospiraceae bacterium]